MNYKKIQQALLFAITLLMMSACSTKYDYTSMEFIHLHETENSKEDYKKIKALAENGDALDMYNLGYYYDMGIGVKQDSNKAVEWYTKSADLDFQEAEYNLALLYKQGKGIPVDTEKAIEYLTKAADKGHVSAQVHLAEIYDSRKDYKNAIEYYQMAVDKGDYEAQYTLGVYYDNGKGVKEDDVKARELFKLAAEQDFVLAFYWTAYFAYQAKDYKEAMYWFKRTAQEDEDSADNAYIYIGVMHERAEGVEQDYKKAFDAYSKATSTTGYHNLSVMYENGRGVEKDEKKSLEYLKKAADMGYAKSQLFYGLKILKAGQPDDGVSWIIKSANQNNEQAIGILKQAGENVDKAILLNQVAYDSLSPSDRAIYNWYKEAYRSN